MIRTVYVMSSKDISEIRNVFSAFDPAHIIFLNIIIPTPVFTHEAAKGEVV